MPSKLAIGYQFLFSLHIKNNNYKNHLLYSNNINKWQLPARVMELVDIADLKSAGPCDRAGSIPAPSK